MSDQVRWGMTIELLSPRRCDEIFRKVLQSEAPTNEQLRDALLCLVEAVLRPEVMAELIRLEREESRCMATAVRCEGLSTRCACRHGHLGAHADASGFQWQSLCSVMRSDATESFGVLGKSYAICSRASGHDGAHVSFDGRVWES